jgi:hypothetical protein
MDASRRPGSSPHPDLENLVEFLLEPIPGGTRLTLRHSGLAGVPELRKDYESGWVEVLGYLTARAFTIAGLAGAAHARPTEE